MIIDRETGKTLIRMRRILLAKVVVSMQNPSELSVIRVDQLQAEFELEFRKLPVPLKTMHAITRYAIEPALRLAERKGYLWVAHRLVEWDL